MEALKATYQTTSAEKTITLGEKLAQHIKPNDSVLLYGDLGMGKTHLIKGLIKGFGIKKRVKSPTYAYVNHYEAINIYHYDLYRLNPGDDLSSIGFWESVEDKQAINLIEWADRITEKELSHIPNRIVVKIDGESDHRLITIQFYRDGILDASEIENYYQEWATPLHVRDHCKTVTNVAMQIAQAYVEVGEMVNFELLYTACMLHDMNRVCDFKELSRDKFFEEISDEKWQRWLDLRKKYEGTHHSEIAYQIFKERGFIETADVVRAHRSDYLVTEPDFFDSLEKKIIYYADKRAKHDEIVDIKERFRDGKERYKKFSNPEKETFFNQVENATHQLEKVLFESLKIKPEDIK